jgi:hypothetical protein
MVAVPHVWPLRLRDGYGSLDIGKVGRVAPRYHTIFPDQMELVVADGGVARVPGDHHSVAIQPLEETAFHREALDSGHVQRRRSSDGPITWPKRLLIEALWGSKPLAFAGKLQPRRLIKSPL